MTISAESRGLLKSRARAREREREKHVVIYGVDRGADAESSIFVARVSCVYLSCERERQSDGCVNGASRRCGFALPSYGGESERREFRSV